MTRLQNEPLTPLSPSSPDGPGVMPARHSPNNGRGADGAAGEGHIEIHRAGAEPLGQSSQPLAASDERKALKRALLVMQDHLDEIDERLARLDPWIKAASLARAVSRGAIRLLKAPFRLAMLLLQWRKLGRCVNDARFRSERLVFDARRNGFVRRADPAAFAGHLRRSLGVFPPPLYTVIPKQRQAFAARPRILHAIANVWTGGSTQLIADLHTHLGHRIEMRVVTSALPARGKHTGMSIDAVPRHDSRHLVRCIFSRFRPHILHVHYWGSVDERWYRTVFEVGAEFGCPIVQNVNTPVAPFAGVQIDRNVFVSRSVLDAYGSQAPASVIYPGIELDRFSPPEVSDPHALDAVGMIYRLENDKLGSNAIELLIEIAKRRPKTRVIIIGDGSLFSHFRARVEQEQLLGQFEFAGFVPYEELPSHLARFKMFVAPVRQESFGQVIPFAMCSGLAVAGYKIGAIPEILGGSETLGSTLDETAGIAVALLDNPQRLLAIGGRNRERALRLFGVEDMAVRYFHLYRELAPHDVDPLIGLPDAIHFPV
ncbi:MAG TPA: glycosyltransferase [Methylocella sp.]|nr:glycosyltransferase [Methylocella sp.]